MERVLSQQLILSSNDQHLTSPTIPKERGNDTEYVRQLIRRLGELIGRTLAEQKSPSNRDK